MDKRSKYPVWISLIVSLGGFLLGFQSAVIAGAVPLYRISLGLATGSFLLGLSVSAHTLGAFAGNLVAGPLSDRFGRKNILFAAAILYGLCALGSALAGIAGIFIFARITGGIAIGFAILIAPVYIAEIAPSSRRGYLVSFNQLNIVIGISLSYFTNLLIYHMVEDPDIAWRWMLGVGLIPAVLWFILLFLIPESPRLLFMKGKETQAGSVLNRIGGPAHARNEIHSIRESMKKFKDKVSLAEVFSSRMKFILLIGFGLAFFQQISGINSILYYAPMIFELAGGGKSASLLQAAMIGLTNFTLTIAAMALIDRLGRRPLLIIGSSGITIALMLAGMAFANATYSLDDTKISKLGLEGLVAIEGRTYTSELAFFEDIRTAAGDEVYELQRNAILKEAIDMHAGIILFALILFVASFAISLGPVLWVMLSEIFPNRLRGLAITVVGSFGGLISFIVVTVFPVELEHFGSSVTFFLFAGFGLISLLFILAFVPETKGKSLEELENILVKTITR